MSPSGGPWEGASVNRRRNVAATLTRVREEGRKPRPTPVDQTEVANSYDSDVACKDAVKGAIRVSLGLVDRLSHSLQQFGPAAEGARKESQALLNVLKGALEGMKELQLRHDHTAGRLREALATVATAERVMTEQREALRQSEEQMRTNDRLLGCHKRLERPQQQQQQHVRRQARKQPQGNARRLDEGEEGEAIQSTDAVDENELPLRTVVDQGVQTDKEEEDRQLPALKAELERTLTSLSEARLKQQHAESLAAAAKGEAAGLKQQWNDSEAMWSRKVDAYRRKGAGLSAIIEQLEAISLSQQKYISSLHSQSSLGRQHPSFPPSAHRASQRSHTQRQYKDAVGGGQGEPGHRQGKRDGGGFGGSSSDNVVDDGDDDNGDDGVGDGVGDDDGGDEDDAECFGSNDDDDDGGGRSRSVRRGEHHATWSGNDDEVGGHDVYGDQAWRPLPSLRQRRTHGHRPPLAPLPGVDDVNTARRQGARHYHNRSTRQPSSTSPPPPPPSSSPPREGKGEYEFYGHDAGGESRGPRLMDMDVRVSLSWPPADHSSGGSGESEGRGNANVGKPRRDASAD